MKKTKWDITWMVVVRVRDSGTRITSFMNAYQRASVREDRVPNPSPLKTAMPFSNTNLT